MVEHTRCKWFPDRISVSAHLSWLQYTARPARCLFQFLHLVPKKQLQVAKGFLGHIGKELVLRNYSPRAGLTKTVNAQNAQLKGESSLENILGNGFAFLEPNYHSGMGHENLWIFIIFMSSIVETFGKETEIKSLTSFALLFWITLTWTGQSRPAPRTAMQLLKLEHT